MNLLDIFGAEERGSRKRDLFFPREEGALFQRAFKVFCRDVLREGGVYVPRERDDHVFGIVPLGNVGEEVCAGEIFHVLRRPEDGPAVPFPAEIRLREHVEAEIVRRVLRHGDLLEHDPLFPVHLLFGEDGTEHEIGEHGNASSAWSEVDFA